MLTQRIVVLPGLGCAEPQVELVTLDDFVVVEQHGVMGVEQNGASKKVIRRADSHERRRKLSSSALQQMQRKRTPSGKWVRFACAGVGRNLGRVAGTVR